MSSVKGWDIPDYKSDQ